MSRTSLEYTDCVYSPDSLDKIVDLGFKQRAIVTQTIVTLPYYEKYRQYRERLFSISFSDFFGTCRCETNICARLPYHTKYLSLR